jgi:hypothetical protein
MLNRKIALAVATLAAIGLVAWVATRDAGRPTPPVIAPLVAPAKGAVQRDERLESADAKRSAIAQSPAPADRDGSISNTELGPVGIGPTAIVRAHCIDENGKPIAGVRLIGLESALVATSGADGRIEGRAKLPSTAGWPVQLALREAFHLKFGASRVLAADQVCDLGAVIMPLGGRIAGRVIDEKGEGRAEAYLASARVSYADWKHTSERDSSTATSGGDGRFELEGVPAGSTRIAARATGYALTEVSPIEVVAGRELRDVTIRLTERSADTRFEFIVRVLTPGGEPSANARVVGEFFEGLGHGYGTYVTDARGACKLHCTADSRLRLRAIDHDQRYSAAYAFDVHASSKSIDLRLGEAAPRTLIVGGENGKPVERFAWRMLDDVQYHVHDTGAVARDAHGVLMDVFRDASDAGGFPSDSIKPADHPDGRVELFTPQIPFVVQVDAEGYAIAEIGPLAQAIAPAEIRVALQALPGVRGRVVAAGAGVPNAWVKLFPARGPDREITVHGFPSRVETTPAVETRTSDDGSFSLSLRDAGTFIVQAGDGSGRESEAAPLSIDPRAGATGIELELLPLGAIDGRVLVGASASARDIVVGASRGEGRPRSVRTDADGRFRFEKLTPGRWLLRQSSEDISPADRESRISYDLPSDAEMPYTCEVRPGETAQVEIDLRAKAELAFDIELPTWAVGKWSAWLEPRGASFGLQKRIGSVDLPELRLSVDQPGEYLLGVSASVASPSHALSIMDIVHLDAGKNVWKLAVPCGELVLANKRSEATIAFLESELSPTRHASMSTHLDAHEERKLSDIPLGRWKRVHWGDAGRAIEDDHVDVTSDGGARVEWN